MPVKQIQLRGISRTPSDRATRDGGCAESLNVHIDSQEVAPTLPPDDFSSNVYGDIDNSEKRPILFIHKMRGIVNYIGHDHLGSGTYGKAIRAFGDSLGSGTGHPGVDYMGNCIITRQINDISSVGNMLIVHASDVPHYFRFTENKYVYLGTRVPRPNVEIATLRWREAEGYYVRSYIENEELRTTDSMAIWQAAIDQDNRNHAGLLDAMSGIWGEISKRMRYYRNRGKFFAPFFIRYALRLYDGRYIHTSTPILCGGYSSDDWMDIKVNVSETGNLMVGTFKQVFDVFLHGTYPVQNWSEIVQGIDFFASAPIYAPKMNAQCTEMSSGWGCVLEGMDSETRENTIHEEVFSKGQFYRVMSIDLSDTIKMNELGSGRLKLENSDSVSGDLLAVEDKSMPDSYRDGVQYIPSSGSQNYNNRLLLSGAKEILSRGDVFLNGQVSVEGNHGQDYFMLRYKIVDSLTGKSHYVAAHYYNEDEEIYQAVFNASGTELRFGDPEPVDSGDICLPFAWIAYPDTRCTEVEVFYSGNNYGNVIPLEKHPYLECACAFLGFGVSLNDLDSSKYEEIDVPSYLFEDREIEQNNKLFLSEFENPFLFPAGNIITFPDAIIGAATTSVPLSEGQMGSFDMYVFTEGGIRVLTANSMGTFSANNAHPNLSRHIALQGSILPIEQAVIFITERGVMLLSGSTVSDLSINMNGKPYKLDDSVQDLIEETDWGIIMGSTVADETFMGFMRNAEVAYDSNAARLIFFHPQKAYQYVYMLQTETWHKIHSGLTNPTILNSYPDCLVSYHPSQSEYKVMDFSTILDDDELLDNPNKAVRGIVVTRPFDLDEPDVRKAIRSIRVRGNLKRRAVQYVLLGSFDGIHWKHLRSLRGGSYKLFRMVLLCNMLPTERISWIDVDYESRYQTRLR